MAFALVSEDGWDLEIGKGMQGGRKSSNKSVEVGTVQSASRARDQSPICLLYAWGPCPARTCSLPHPPPLGRWAHGAGLRGGCRHVCPGLQLSAQHAPSRTRFSVAGQLFLSGSCLCVDVWEGGSCPGLRGPLPGCPGHAWGCGLPQCPGQKTSY